MSSWVKPHLKFYGAGFSVRKDTASFVHKFASDFPSCAAQAGEPDQPSPCRFLPLFLGCPLGRRAHADAPPAAPSCDALHAQLRLTSICRTSTVFQALRYALGEKRSLSGHSSAFQEFIDSELVKLNKPQHTGIGTQGESAEGPEAISGEKAFRVGAEGHSHEQRTLGQDANAKRRARLEERFSWMTIPQPHWPGSK